MVASGYLVEQCLLLVVSCGLLGTLLVQSWAETHLFSEPRLKRGGLKYWLHRITLAGAVLMVAHDVDPRGALGIIPYGYSSLLSQNCTCLLIVAVSLAFYFWMRPAYLLLNRTMPPWIAPALVAWCAGAVLVANTVGVVSVLLGHTPNNMLAAWMLYLAFVFSASILLVNWVVLSLRAGLKRMLDEPRHAGDPMAASAADRARIERRVQQMRRVQLLMLVIGVCAVGMQVHVSYECLRRDEACHRNTRYQDRSHYQFHPPYLLIWFTHASFVILGAYCWMPVVLRRDRPPPLASFADGVRGGRVISQSTFAAGDDEESYYDDAYDDYEVGGTGDDDDDVGGGGGSGGGGGGGGDEGRRLHHGSGSPVPPGTTPAEEEWPAVPPA